MDKTLIQKFFSGEATKTERIRFMEWLRTEASEMEVEQEVKRYFKGNTNQTFLWDDDEVLKKLQMKIMTLEDDVKESSLGNEALSSFAEKNRKPRRQESFVRRLDVVRMLKVAAMLFLISFISILSWRSYEQHKVQTGMAVTEMLTKSTGQGQKLSFYLDDGSKVILNASSKITFPSKFTGGERKISMEGEAYFEVVKDASKPFVVASGDYMTEVLGTSFVVDADKESGHITVGLRSGKVKVEKLGGPHGDASPVLLKPGEMLTVDLNTGRRNVAGFEDVAIFGWTDGILYFKDAPFREVANRLEEWYDVQFTFNEQPQIDKKYSGKFVNETLDNVLKGLSFVDDFDYSIAGKNVTIKFREP